MWSERDCPAVTVEVVVLVEVVVVVVVAVCRHRLGVKSLRALGLGFWV